MEHAGFASELIARKRAAEDMAAKDVVIIESRGQFYVELSDDAPMIRSWEREVFTGKGINAIPKNYFECERCGQFNKGGRFKRCVRCNHKAFDVQEAETPMQREQGRLNAAARRMGHQ